MTSHLVNASSQRRLTNETLRQDRTAAEGRREVGKMAGDGGRGPESTDRDGTRGGGRGIVLNLVPMERNLADSVESTDVPISIVDDGNGRLAPGSAVGRLVLPHEGGGPSHANAGPHELSLHEGLLFLTTPWGAAPGLLALGEAAGDRPGDGYRDSWSPSRSRMPLEALAHCNGRREGQTKQRSAPKGSETVANPMSRGPD